ncbi:hypothetical protein NOC27_66 [Nitrosococcus oceani AFC27]|nr:hypothetical protein NOC27_66 [Nitrosococcus oceani AFC27]
MAVDDQNHFSIHAGNQSPEEVPEYHRRHAPFHHHKPEVAKRIHRRAQLMTFLVS